MKFVNLSDICEIIAGQSPPSSTYNKDGDGLPFFQGKADFGELYPKARIWCSKPKKIAEVGDILISVRAPVGSTNICDTKACIGRGLSAIRVNDQIQNDFLLFYLRAVEKSIASLGRGSTFKAITQKDLQQLQIPLPSIDEQKRLVNAFSQSDSLYQKRKISVDLLSDYVDSIFFSMFVKNVNKKNIPLVKLEAITTKITDGVHFRPKYTESGIPFISVTNVTNKKLNFYNCKFISLEDHKKFITRCKPELGDVLYTKVGATYGRACVVDDKREFSLYVSVALIKPIQNIVTPAYLKAVLNSSFVKHQADRSVKGAGVPDLHLIEIKNFDIPLPEIEEQNKFTEIVRQVEELRQQMLAQSNALETQFKSLIQKSFKTSADSFYGNTY